MQTCKPTLLYQTPDSGIKVYKNTKNLQKHPITYKFYDRNSCIIWRILLDPICNPIVSPDHADQLQYRTNLYFSNKNLQSPIKFYNSGDYVICKSQNSTTMLPRPIRSLHGALWLNNRGISYFHQFNNILHNWIKFYRYRYRIPNIFNFSLQYQKVQYHSFPMVPGTSQTVY